MSAYSELFDILNENGELTGEARPRSEVHRKGLLHASVHIWAARRRLGGTEYLLQKRADNKDSYPGCYDASATGHIDSGEDAISAAIRELFEEIGIRARPSELVLLCRRRVNEDNVFHGERFLNSEIKWIFLLNKPINERSIVFDPNEVSEVKWISEAELSEALNKNDPTYCIDREEFIEVAKLTEEILV